MRDVLVPLGAHSAFEPAGPDDVAITFRTRMVVADPARAIEAAARRARSRDAVARLTAVRRVVRTRRFVTGFYSHRRRRRDR